MVSFWTDERVETLKRLWADGVSTAQIANELGAKSRNAIIGKASRLGLPSRPAITTARQVEGGNAAQMVRRIQEMKGGDVQKIDNVAPSPPDQSPIALKMLDK